MIYLKLQNKPETPNNLFYYLFSYYCNGQLKSCETFSDAECVVSECKKNKYRSADDIVEIVQTYFPEVNEKEVFTDLLHCIIEYDDTSYYPYLIHCDNISRPTICFFRSVHPQIHYKWKSITMEKSKYKNWAQICNIVGIESEEQLENLHK